MVASMAVGLTFEPQVNCFGDPACVPRVPKHWNVENKSNPGGANIMSLAFAECWTFLNLMKRGVPIAK